MPPPRRSWVEQIMGMPVSVLARGPRAQTPAAAAAVLELYGQLREVDAVFSTYRPDSVVSRINAGALRLSDAPPVVREVAEHCAAARASTGGLFDATRPDGGWDPSGLVKGWAAEEAARILWTGVPDLDWCLNAGGDVLVRCPSGTPFVVGIADPRDPRAVAAAVPVRDGALATSGTAARGDHIYDPRSGDWVVRRWASVSVLGPSLRCADVLATASFVAGEGALELVAAYPGYAGLTLEDSGARSASPGWPRSASS